MLKAQLEQKDLNSSINLPFSMKIKTLEIPNIIRKYEDGDSSTELAKEYNVTPVSILGLLKRRGVRIKSQSEAQKRYNIDDTFFENINTENKAYWLGFLWADGYLNNFALTLTLSIKDKEHLKKFLISLKTNRPLKEYNYSYAKIIRVNLSNKKIVQDLKKQGFLDRRNFPNINKGLIYHFIRGLFDGDGCVSNRKNRGNPYFSLLAEELLLLKLKNIFMNIGLSDTKLKKRHKDSKSNVLAIEYVGRNNIKKIYEYLYKDATIFLERKKLIFEQIEKQRPQEKRCSIIGCENKHYGLGLCKNHYYQEYGNIKRKERYLKYGK